MGCCEVGAVLNVQHFHFAQRLGDGSDRCVHVDGTDVPDTADAERFDLGQFAGVQDETLGLDPFVERFEVIARVCGGVERHDNRRLNRCG